MVQRQHNFTLFAKASISPSSSTNFVPALTKVAWMLAAASRNDFRLFERSMPEVPSEPHG
jgi:hypothetical protein